jgi:hypothetical protein
MRYKCPNQMSEYKATNLPVKFGESPPDPAPRQHRQSRYPGLHKVESVFFATTAARRVPDARDLKISVSARFPIEHGRESSDVWQMMTFHPYQGQFGSPRPKTGFRKINVR